MILSILILIVNFIGSLIAIVLWRGSPT